MGFFLCIKTFFIVICQLLCPLVSDVTWQGEGGEIEDLAFLQKLENVVLPSGIVVQFEAALKQITFSNSQQRSEQR